MTRITGRVRPKPTTRTSTPRLIAACSSHLDVSRRTTHTHTHVAWCLTMTAFTTNLRLKTFLPSNFQKRVFPQQKQQSIVSPVSVFLSGERWYWLTHYFISWTMLYSTLIFCKHILLKLFSVLRLAHRSPKNCQPLRLSIYFEHDYWGWLNLETIAWFASVIIPIVLMPLPLIPRRTSSTTSTDTLYISFAR